MIFELKSMIDTLKIRLQKDISNSKTIICIRDANTKKIIGISNNIYVLDKINYQGIERMPCSDTRFLEIDKMSKKILNKAKQILRG